MGDVVRELTRKVAFVLSETSGDDEWVNWDIVEGLVFGGIGLFGSSEVLEARIGDYLVTIPSSAVRRCDPSGLGYLAERICAEGWPIL